MGVGGEQHPGRVEVLLGEHLHLGEQHCRVDDRPRRDHRCAVGVVDAGGDEREGQLLLADDDGVPGVVAALEAHHVVGSLGEVVDHAALAFVAPLGTENDGRCHDGGDGSQSSLSLLPRLRIPPVTTRMGAVPML